MIITRWTYINRFGTWQIVKTGNRWELWWDNEDLGSYGTVALALDDLAGGHCFWPSSGIDPGNCALPDDLSEWTAGRGKS